MKQDIKEILELAAKACGYTRTGTNFNGWFYVGMYPNNPIDKWHPHEDDGDGARMEEKLGIEFEWQRVGVVCSEWVGQDLAAKWLPAISRIRESYADHNGNRQAARRMASLRVAAHIGERMRCK